MSKSFSNFFSSTRVVFIFFFFFSLFEISALERIVSPLPGTYCNKQPFILDLSDGAECYYSLTGSSPMESGLAYDGPFVIEAEGDVELNLIIISGENVESRKINYTVKKVNKNIFPAQNITSQASENIFNIELPSNTEHEKIEFTPTEEEEFITKISENPIQTLFSDELFKIPETFLYSFENGEKPYLQGSTLKLDENCIISRYIPVNVSYKKHNFRFVIKSINSNAGFLTKKDIPFEIENWTRFTFTGDKLIWSIDGGLWSASKKPFLVDRRFPHVISWQDVAFQEGNQIFRYEIPAKPELVVSGGGNSPVKIAIEGDESYKMSLLSSNFNYTITENNGAVTQTTIDCFDGEHRKGEADFVLYSNGIKQGILSVPYEIDKLCPKAPRIMASTTAMSFARENVKVNIDGDYGCDFFVSVSEGVVIENVESLSKLSTENFMNSVEMSDFFPFTKGTIILHSDDTKPVFYKIAAYAVDKAGNKSDTTYFSTVIDENNFYLGEKTLESVDEDLENGSYLAPFTSFDKILKIINSGKFSRVYIDGEIKIPGGSYKINSNCEFIGKKNTHLIFSPNADLKISNCSATFKSIIIEKQKHISGTESKNSFMQFENATSDFDNCEILGVFADSGITIETTSSTVTLTNSGITSQAMNYTSAISATRSKIFINSSRFSTIAQTSVNFSISNSIFEMKKSDTKVSGRLGRIAEFNKSEIKLSDNIYAGDIELKNKTKPNEPVWKDESSKIYENKGNLSYGF